MKNKSIFLPSILLPFRSAIFILSGLLLTIILKSSLNDLSRWWTVIVLFCNAATILLLLLVCRQKGISYGKFVNYEKGKTKFGDIFIVTFVMLVVGMGGMQFAGLLVYSEIPHFPIAMMQPLPMWIAIANILVLPLTTALAEDGLYLGVLNQTDSKFVLISSAFFYALQHSFIPLLPDPRFIAYRFLSFLPLTVIMCVWYSKSKNPLPFMVGHFIINLATVVQIVLVSASPGIFDF